MRLRDYVALIDTGGFRTSPHGERIDADLRAAIDHVRWPEGAADFTIYAESGKRSGEGNGVKPIKLGFIELLVDRGWKPEARYRAVTEPPDSVDADKSTALYPGAFDVRLELGGGDNPFVAEWRQATYLEPSCPSTRWPSLCWRGGSPAVSFGVTHAATSKVPYRPHRQLSRDLSVLWVVGFLGD